jgi:sortase (surface protein transpeptidase)
LALTIGVWALITFMAAGLVCYGFGSLFQQRAQRTLMTEYRAALYDASVSVAMPGQQATAPLPPVPGAPVGILEIGAIRLQQVVVEGVAPSQTENGPGHVPGTPGFGQAGNVVVVGRRSAFGGPFVRIGTLKPGAQILAATTQGESVYRVSTVFTASLTGGDGTSSETVAGSSTGSPTTAGSVPSGTSTTPSSVPVDSLYAQGAVNQLTLVTSASGAPWNSTRATVVVAQLVGLPFAPTAQEGRSDSYTGANGSVGALAPLVLILMGYAVVALTAVVAYRRYSSRAAWLLTTPPLVVLTVLIGEVGAQVLPAWL